MCNRAKVVAVQNWQQRATRALLSAAMRCTLGAMRLTVKSSWHVLGWTGVPWGCAVRQLEICASSLALYRPGWGECQSVGDESACAQGGRGFPPRSGLPGGRSTSSIIGRAHAWVMKGALGDRAAHAGGSVEGRVLAPATAAAGPRRRDAHAAAGGDACMQRSRRRRHACMHGCSQPSAIVHGWLHRRQLALATADSY
jgi:hypothetical protein